jgi:hypothetical protein
LPFHFGNIEDNRPIPLIKINNTLVDRSKLGESPGIIDRRDRKIL